MAEFNIEGGGWRELSVLSVLNKTVEPSLAPKRCWLQLSASPGLHWWWEPLGGKGNFEAIPKLA